MDLLRRSAALPALVIGDTARRARMSFPAEAGVPDGALEAAISWLCLTHDVTGRRGSALAYHMLHGWRPAFPETTGYIIGTLLEHAARTGDESLVTRAQEMGDWEIDVQNPDGGVMTDAVKSPPGQSVAFNTGMVIFGWLDLHEKLGDERYLQAAVRAGEWLERTQEADGTWQGENDYGGIPHTYCSRVDWALLRLAAASGEERFRDVAVRHLDWVLSVQHENGWFDWCVFRTGTFPSTHALAYTMRGLLESSALGGDRRYLEAAQKTARALMGIFYTRGWLPATYDREWTAQSRSICITGLAQVGGVWLRLYQETGDVDFRRAGIAAVEQAAALQTRSRWRAIDGAVAGSFPIYGRYAPLQYPNWSAKFLADSLALRERILGNGR